MSVLPILALHGNLGSAREWSAVGLPGLTAVDLWDFVELDFFEMAHRLATDLSGGMARPVLAGYSLGGRLALHAMAIHPERWGGAVILAAHPGLCCGDERLARRRSDRIWAEKARALPWDDFLVEWNRQDVFAGSPPSEGQAELESKRGEIALAFETWTLGRQEDLRSQLRRFHAPVLWITGAGDPKFSALGAEMAEVFPRFQHHILPGAGHRVLGPGVQDPVLAWLSSALAPFPA